MFYGRRCSYDPIARGGKLQSDSTKDYCKGEVNGVVNSNVAEAAG